MAGYRRVDNGNPSDDPTEMGNHQPGIMLTLCFACRLNSATLTLVIIPLTRGGVANMLRDSDWFSGGGGVEKGEAEGDMFICADSK